MRPEHTLYVVATPIGHLDDLSARAIRTLSEVGRVYAEDTRHSLPLLRRHGIDTPLRALHEHNEALEAERVVAYLRERGDAALISDAGTPLISDPGFRVVRACREAGIAVSPVPGPCAISAALSVGGLPTDRFQFVGFPPSRGGARRRWIGALAAVPHTLVLYESPHRILDTLGDLAEAFGATREATLARELTKRHETVLSGTLAEIGARVAAEANQRRGEFVLIVAGTAWRGAGGEGRAADERALDAKTAKGAAGGIGSGAGAVGTSGDARTEAAARAGKVGSEGEDVRWDEAPSVGASAVVPLDRLIEVLLPSLPPKEIARCAATLCGVRKREAYARVLVLQQAAGGEGRR